MPLAVCASCGRKKRRPDVKCRECGADPTTNEELMVKSVYLSAWRFDEPHQRLEYTNALKAVGAGLRQGRPVDYDAEELARIRKQLHEGRAMQPAMLGCAARFFVPEMIFFLGILLLAYFRSRAH
jgi:hypothetical protein